METFISLVYPVLSSNQFYHQTSSIIKSVLSSNVHFPRLSSSIIKTLGVCVNGTLIERIDNSNTLYNKVYDLDGGGMDQTPKRFLENADPCIGFSVATNSNETSAATPLIKTRASTPSHTRQNTFVTYGE